MVKLYEHEGKEIFQKYGIDIPPGVLAFTPEKAKEKAVEIGLPVVIKAQIYSGKRGKSGGIIFAETENAVVEETRKLLGSKINGINVEKVLIEKKSEIKKEYYAAVLSNPNTRKPVVILSDAGGIDVEDSGSEHVEHQDVDIMKGYHSYDARNLSKKLGFAGKELMAISAVLNKMYDIYRHHDCKLIEINPLALTERGFSALDSKIDIDDDSIYRQKDLNIDPGEDVGDREPTCLENAAGEIDNNDHRGSAHFVQIDPTFEYSKEINKVPIGFDGVGTGVSLVMMDELVPLGFYPVNFCDTSGNPTASKLYRVTRIIFEQKGIQGYVFISCISSQQLDNTARGIIKALKEIYPKTGGVPDVPCIFVFRGAWDQDAIKMFDEHGISDCEWVQVAGRDVTEKEAAILFSDLYHKWKESTDSKEMGV